MEPVPGSAGKVSNALPVESAPPGTGDGREPGGTLQVAWRISIEWLGAATPEPFGPSVPRSGRRVLPLESQPNQQRKATITTAEDDRDTGLRPRTTLIGPEYAVAVFRVTSPSGRGLRRSEQL